jgi:hypothetical protein
MQTLSLAALPALAITLAALNQSAAPLALRELDLASQVPAAPVEKAREPGLRHAGLQTSSLRTASLDSAARGLTPESEWRAVFPKRQAAR